MLFHQQATYQFVSVLLYHFFFIGQLNPSISFYCIKHHCFACICTAHQGLQEYQKSFFIFQSHILSRFHIF